MKTRIIFFPVLLILLICFWSCEKESLEAKERTKIIQLKKGGKGNGGGKGNEACIVYEWSYSCVVKGNPEVTQPSFTGSGTFEACIDDFRGFDRIIGTVLNPSISCLGTSNSWANANCYGLVELWTRMGKNKYHVVLTGGSWSNTCAPISDTYPITTCIEFWKMEITPDGRHDKNCLRPDGPETIPVHTFCLTNNGPVPTG